MFGRQHFYSSAALPSLTVQHNIKIVKIKEMVVSRSVFSLLFTQINVKNKTHLKT